MKKSIKPISLIIAALLITLLFSTLLSCNKNDADNTADDTTNNTAPEPVTDPLPVTPDSLNDELLKIPEDAKREIQLAFLEKVYGEEYKKDSYMPEDVPIECYGIFDDAYCVILWDKTGGRMGTVTEVTVAGYRFVYGTPDIIQVYFNEALYDLTTAYENGILDETEIAELYTNYNEKHLKNKAPSTLTEEIKQEIQIARLIEAHGEDYAEKGQTLSDVYLECYGIFDSAYCVLLRTANITVLPVGKTLTVCGYDFEFGLAQEVMRVYYNGELCDLDEAYENGILDDDEVAELYDYYQKSNWYK